MRLKELDVVRTKFGTIAVVNQVGAGGRVSLVLPATSKQKFAWYAPEELEFIASVKDLQRPKDTPMFTASRIYLNPPQTKVDSQETAKSSDELDDIAQAVLAEREACAAVCEQLQDWPESATPYDCAAAIRSRNTP